MPSDNDKNRMRQRYLRGTRKQEKREDIRSKRARKRATDPDDPLTRRRRDEEWSPVDEFEPTVRRRKRKKSVAPPPANDPNGVVVALTAGFATVDIDGTEHRARLAPAVRRDQQVAIAVGDDVACERRDDAFVVTGIGARRSSLSRRHPGNEHRERVLVANVDHAIIVLSVVRPVLRASLVDRMLVAIGDGGVDPIVCVNKVDLLEGDATSRETMERSLAVYEALGVPCLRVSAESGAGIDRLRTCIDGKRVVFVGHSGVGKSALLNRLDPEHARDVGSGRDFDGKGRHTTRGSRLARLDDAGTEVIDTPGIRAFGLWRMDPLTLARAFPDFRSLAPCRFNDCVHADEPGCTVLAALARGDLTRARYDAYVRLGTSLE